jgi:FemAB-related protein (PEP-CTERM system-associated)
MSVSVDRFTGDGARWDAVVRAHAGWTHFHLYGWRSVMERVFGHECVFLAASDDSGRLVGVLPLVRVRSLLFGHYLVSMPFLNYGGPLGDTAAVVALTEHAVALAQRDGVKLLELRSRTELPIGLTASHRKVTSLLDLPRFESPRAWTALDSKVRSQIRRPQKDGVVLRLGPDQLEPFYHVFARHMRDLGTPAQPQRLFEAIAAQFGDDVTFACAYHNGVPIAGACGFRWNEEFEITWAAALNEHRRLSANMLVYWALIERAADTGCSIFNFGRCTPGSGTHRFKQQWGTRDEQLWWYDWAPRANTQTPSPTTGPYSWGPHVWRRLPPSVAASLGPRIVRYLP